MDKKTTISTHKNDSKGFSQHKTLLGILYITIVMVLLQVNLVMSLDWDNSKKYIEEEQKITITNSFGFGDDIAELTLLTPHTIYVTPGLNVKVAEIEINLNSDSYFNALKQMQFYDVNNNLREYSNKGFAYKQRIKIGEEEVNDYEWTCEDIGVAVNGSQKFRCSDKLIGSHLEPIYEWEELSTKNLNKGKMVIGIFTNVSNREHTEWIPTFFGVRIDEWAEFIGSTRYEWHTAGDDDRMATDGTGDDGGIAQNFTIGTVGENIDFNLTGISLKLYRVNAPVDLGFGVYSVDGSSFPSLLLSSNTTMNQADLTNAAEGAWYNITLPGVTLSSSTQYAIGVNITASAGNSIAWRRQSIGNYTGGNAQLCSANWTCAPRGYDLMFEVWGVKLPTGPTVTQNIPTNLQNFTIDENIIFNCTTTDDKGVVNVSIAINDVINSTVTNTTTGENLSIQDSINFSQGVYNWSCLASDADKNESVTSNRTFDVYKVLPISEFFSTVTTEGASEFFQLNATTTSSLQISSANLVYNNTFYTGTLSPDGNNYTISRTLVVPSFGALINNSFFWSITMQDGSNFNITTHNQTVTPISVDDCSVNAIRLMNLSLMDEVTLVLMNGTVEVELQLFPLGSSIATVNFTQNFTMDTQDICLEKDLANGVYRLDTLIKYSSEGYASEFYHIQNLTLRNSSLPQDISLLDLDDNHSQVFKIIFKDSNFLAVEDALIQIQRKYINQGVFRTAEVPKTDTDGETIAHLQVEDTIYTIFVTKNGVTLAIFEDVVAICQNPALDDCVLNLNQFGSSINLKDYTIGDDFTFTLTHNKTSRIVTTIFSIPSGASSEIVLNVTLLDGLGTTEVCSDSLTTTAGTLTCTVPINLGNGTIIATITKDGTKVGQAFISLAQDPEDLYGANIVFLGLFLVLTLIGVGLVDNPMIASIFIGISAILLISMNLISTGEGGSFIGAGATVLWLFIAIILVLIKGSRRT